jgi:hypothetical protein
MDNSAPIMVPLTPAATAWIARVFDATIVDRGGIVRRSAASVDREIGRTVFAQQVMMRGFHLVECGDQFVVICNSGHIKIIV